MKIPFLIAGPQSVTAVFAQICFYEVTLAIDLAGLSQIHLPATDPSCAATSSDSTLISVGCQHALPSYTKIHSAALAAPPPDISRGFLPWRLSDAGLGPSRSAAIGRHPKPSTDSEMTPRNSTSVLPLVTGHRPGLQFRTPAIDLFLHHAEPFGGCGEGRFPARPCR